MRCQSTALRYSAQSCCRSIASKSAVVLALLCTLSGILASSRLVRAQSPGDFTVVVLPDTQYYSQNYPAIFDAQTTWIAKNAAAQNIKLILGEGDIVNVGTDMTQWSNAVHSVGILDAAGIPYAFAIGNHDYDTLPPTSRSATHFNQYFGPARYAGRTYYGNSNYPSGSNENFYETFTWGGNKYLVLVLEFVPRAGAVAWAKSILGANPDKEAIVLTHTYLYGDGTTVDQCDTADMIGDENGAMLWTNLLSQYANVSVVMNGHIVTTFAARRSDVGVNGNFVHQLFANWQSWTNGGNGYLRIVRFSPSNNTIQVQTYSPYTGLYLTDATNQFTLKWHNNGAAGSGIAQVSGRARTNVSAGSCQAIAGATINIGGVTTTTDGNGYYGLSLPPGQFQGTASAPGYQTSSVTASLNDFFSNEVNFYLNIVPPCPQSSANPSVTICTPLNGATVTSPVKVVAGENSSAALNSLAVWLDGVKVFVTGTQQVNTSVSMVAGRHLLAVQGMNWAKQVFTQTISVTVPPTKSCTPGTTDPSVTICNPAANATVQSPVGIVAATRDSTANVTNMFIWVDGVKQWTGSGGSVNTSIAMPSGTHRITVQAKDSLARYFQSTVYATVP